VGRFAFWIVGNQHVDDRSCLSISFGVQSTTGPFTGAEPLKDVMSLQLFLFFAATTFMVLAVLVEDQKKPIDPFARAKSASD